MSAASEQRTGWLVAAIAFAAAVLMLTGLGWIDLWAPDEPRYAQIAEEMRSFVHGVRGLVLLHLNGDAYTQKPPLYFWLAALFGWPLGHVTEVAARLPSALAGIACVIATAVLGRRLYRGTLAGIWGAAVLLTVLRFAHQARRAQLDLLLALLELLALSAWWRIASTSADARAPRILDLLTLHGVVGLAVLTKGPVGLLPYGVIVLHRLWEQRRDPSSMPALRTIFPPWAFILSLAPGILWVTCAAALAPDGFLASAVFDNVVGRFFAGTAHVRPFYYFAYQLPLDFLPWTVLWPIAVWGIARRLRLGGSEGDRFLLIWLTTMFVFFSLSAGKRGLYLLPAFPAAALLCGAAIDQALRDERSARWLDWIGTGLLVSLAAGALALDFAAAVDLRAFALTVVGICAVVALVRWRFAALAHRSSARLLCTVVAVFCVELATFSLLYPALDPEKSPRPIAEAAARLGAPDASIATYGEHALAGGIAYYSGRPVVAAETPGALRRYVASNGRAIVLGERRLAEARSVIPLTVVSTSRSGRRRLLLCTPTTPGSAVPTAEPAERP